MDWDEQKPGQERRRSDGAQHRRQPDRPAGRKSPAKSTGQGSRRSAQSTGRSGQSREPARRPRQETPDRQAEKRKAEQRARRQEEKRRAEQAAKRREERRRAQEQKEKRRQQAQRRKQAAKRRTENRRTPPKALPRRQLIWKLVTTAAVVLALVLGVTIFFKVQNVQVTGNEKYTSEAVLDASGIEMGENLLTFGKARAAGKILAELPYVDQVQIGIKLPNTVNIDIVELEVIYAVRALDDSWWLMDSGGKLLEPVEEAEAEQHIRVLGIRAEAPAAGHTLSPADPQSDAAEQTETTQGAAVETAADRAKAALEILQALETSDHLGDVTVVDVSELYDIQLWYGQQYQVRLGGPTELSYKIKYMTASIATLPDYQSGVLDITFQNDRRGVFTPWQ